MKISIQSLGFTPQQSLLDAIDSKMEKLLPIYEDIISMDVRLDYENTSREIEVTVHIVGRKTIVVKKNADTFEAALDDLYGALRTSIRRHKEKKRDRD